MRHATVTAACAVAECALLEKENACPALGGSTRRGEAGEAAADDDPVHASRERLTRGHGEVSRVGGIVVPGNGVELSLHCARVARDSAVAARGRV
jgi:hypothetical protein